jgi:hypothetical protein
MGICLLLDYRFSADKLAEKLCLKFEERKAVGITTIGAINRPKQQRAKDRATAKQKRDRERAMRKSVFGRYLLCPGRHVDAGRGRISWHPLSE